MKIDNNAQLQSAYLNKQALVTKVLEEARDETGAWDLSRVTTFSGSVEEKRSALDVLVAEVDDLSKKLTENAELEAIKDRMSDDYSSKHKDSDLLVAQKDKDLSLRAADALFETWYDSREFKYKSDWEYKKEFDLRTLFNTASAAYPNEQPTEVVGSAIRPIMISPHIPTIPTTDGNVSYLEQTTRTNAAAARAEGAAAAESAIVYTNRNVVVRSIDTSIPVTDEILADKPQMRSIITSDLMLMVAQELDDEIINGSGTGVRWTGLNVLAGVQAQNKGSDDHFTATAKMKTKIIATGRAMPTHVMMHPNDWLEFMTARAVGAASLASGGTSESTVNTYDGAFLWTHPSVTGPDTLWNMQVIQTTSVPEGTIIMADVPRYTRLRDRQSYNVKFGLVNTQFTEREMTILAGVRAAFYVTRAGAVGRGTGY